MISLKYLLEDDDQLELNFDSPENNGKKEFTDPETVKYMNKVDSYMSSKGNDSHWQQMRPHLELYFDKIASPSIKSRMVSDLGAISADPTDVAAMNVAIKQNIYLTNVDLNNLARIGSITTKEPYNLPLVNGAGTNPGAGELSLQLAHSGVSWVGGSDSQDASFDQDDKTYIIDVKDETKMGPGSSGIDMGNTKKKGLKIFYDGSELLKLQTAVVRFMKLVEAFKENPETFSQRLFFTKEAATQFDRLGSEAINAIMDPDSKTAKYSYMDRVNDMLRFAKQRIDITDPYKVSKHLVLAQTNLQHTLNVQCVLNQIRNFLEKYSDQINMDTRAGQALLNQRYHEVLEPWWLVKTYQKAIDIDIPGNLINNEGKYDYVLVVDKDKNTPPHYFKSNREDMFITSFFNPSGAGSVSQTKLRAMDPGYLEIRADELGLDISAIADLSVDDIDPCRPEARAAKGPNINLAIEMYKVLKRLRQQES